MRYSPTSNAFYPEEFDYGQAMPGDVILIDNAYHAELMAACAGGKIIAPGVEGVPTAVDPPAADIAAIRAGMHLSFTQLLIGLEAEAWITTAEAEAWLDGALPGPVNALIATLPAGQRFAAKARATRPSVVERLNPLVIGLAAASGKTDAELDAFFLGYAAI